MGFKRISLKDLETSMTPAFLGLPLKHIEERELLKIAQKEQKISKIEKESNVLLLNEEILEYNYDKNGEIENFIGSGNITIINNSKKDRIWDTKLILSGTQYTNIQSEEAIKLGNFEPKSNKLINYSIMEYEKLTDPVKVTELIEVLDLNTEKIDSMQHEISVEAEEDEIISQKIPEKIKIKDLDLPKSEDALTIKKEKITNLEEEPLDRKASLKKEVDNEFEPKIEIINLKLDNEREALEEINKELKEYATNKKKQNNIINDIKKNYDSLLKAKLNALNKKLKQFPKEAKTEKPTEHESLLNDIKSRQISENEENISKIEEKYSKKENTTTKKDVDNEYDPQINSIKSELSIKQEDLNEATKNITDWNEKKKELSEIIKNLKKKHKTLPPTKTIVQSTKLKKSDEEEPSIKEIESQNNIKEEEIKKVEEEYLKKEATLKKEVDNTYDPQIKSLESKLNAEQKNLDENMKNFNELNKKKKELTNSIKTIKREHETLLKTKSKELSTRLKETPKNEEFIRSVEKEVDNTYDPQIKSLESKLNAEQKNLDENMKNFNEWSVKKNESSDIVKNLKKEHENLLKTKSKELRTRLKAIPDKQKAEKEIEEDYLKKESTAKKEIDNEFDPQIEKIDSKLSIEQKNLDDTIENVHEWSAKKNETSDIIKNLKKKYETLLKTKSKALNKKLFEMRLKEISIDDESESEKKLEKEINDEFEPQIKNADSKLSVEQKNLDEAIKNVNEWIAKKIELSVNIKNLNKERKDLLKAKSKALNIRLKKITGIDEFSTKVEKEVKDEFDPKIESIESKLNAKQKILDEVIKNFNEWSAKKNESSTIVKNLKKEYKTLLKAKSKELHTRLKAIPDEEKTEKKNKDEILKKEATAKKEIDNEFDPQIKSLESKSRAEQKNLDEITKKIDELNEKKKELSNSIKIIKKEYENLLKSKPITLNTRLKELIKEKKRKIEEIKNQVSKKQDEITKFKVKTSKKVDSIESEVKDKYVPQIESVKAELNVEKENLKEVIKKIDEWTIKRKEIDEIIKDLKNNQKKLLKAKSKALSTRLKEINEEKEIKLNEFRSQIRAKQEELKKIKEGTSIIETSVEKEVEIEYEPKINSVKSKLDVEQKNLDKIIKTIDDLTNKKNELINNIKDLEKTRKSLLKAKSKALSKRLKDISRKEITEKKPDLDKKDDEITRIEEEYSKIEVEIKKEVEEEFSPQIKSIDSKLNIERENFDEAIKNVNEWNTKKNELSSILKNLKKDHKSLLKARFKAIGAELKEEIKSQINIKEEEIEKIEEEYLKKEVTIKNEDEFDSQIKSLNSKSRAEQKNLDEVIKNINELNEKKKELSNSIKTIKREHETLLKTKSKELSTRLKETPIDEESAKRLEKEVEDEFDSQIKSLELKLKAEQKNLDEVIKNVNELNEKKKELSNSIKIIKREHESLLKTKSKTQSMRLKEIIEEKKIKIKEIRSQISEKEDEITKFKKKPSKKVDFIESKVIDKDLTQITSVESELRVKQESLDDAIKNFNEWNEKIKKLNETVKELKKKERKILKAKSKALSTRLKEIYEERKIKINEIKEEIKTKKKAEPKIKETEKIHEDEAVSESSAIDVISSKAKEKEIEKGEAEEKLFIPEFDKLGVQNNLILLYNQKNTLKFTISLENITKYIMEDITIGKIFSEDFLNFKYESKTISNVELIKNNIICTLKELKPNEKADIVIFADINPKEKKLIGTGRIQLSYNYKDYLISGINFENFTAYSHAMHAIKIKEKETEANLWLCSLIFKNNSDLDMELNSILVLDKKKENKYIDLDFSSEKERHLIKPGEKFISKEWNVKDENEPKFFRKLGYSITHRIVKNSKINIKFEEDIFDIVDLDISKRFSETEIKSFEEEVLDCIINIKNIGTIPIKGLMIIDLVPEDFLPPIKLSDYHLRRSTGKKVSGDIKLNIRSNNQDHTIPHIIEIKINSEKKSDNLLDVNEFLEIKYQFNAISPSYRKKYDFKLDINSYFLKEKINPENYYCIENSLRKNKQPELTVIHKRRDLLISKEIFPGRTVDEFVINILINNNSNIELNNIEIKDTISKSFELLNSNIKYMISESEEGNDMTLSFIVDRILPYQESEIRYYVKNKSGKKIDYDELESFIFG